jgi:hypothetical protein
LKIKPSNTTEETMKAFAKFGIDETTIGVGDEIFIHASQKYTPVFHGDNYIAWIDRNEDGTIKQFATTNYNCIFTEKMRIKTITMDSPRFLLTGAESKHKQNKVNDWLVNAIRRGLFAPVADMNQAHEEWCNKAYRS